MVHLAWVWVEMALAPFTITKMAAELIMAEKQTDKVDKTEMHFADQFYLHDACSPVNQVKIGMRWS